MTAELSNNTIIELVPNGKLNQQLYDIYNANVFVFITKKLFNDLNSTCSDTFCTSDDNLTIEQMFNTKVFFIKMDNIDRVEIAKIVEYSEHYKKKLDYLIMME